MRTFISVDLPEDVVLELVKIQKEIDKLGLVKGKFIEQENLHITLKFLGELSRSEIEAVREKISGINFSPIKLSIGKIGVFSEDFIRIIWINILGDGLAELQKTIDESLKDLFPLERGFAAHITLARPKFVEDKKVLIEELGKINFENKSFYVKDFCLKKSELTAFGAKYTPVMEVKASQELEIISHTKNII